MKPLSTCFFFFALAPAACYFINYKLAQSPYGVPHTESVCDPSQRGVFSAPQPYAQGGIRLDWLAGLARGGMPCMLVDVFTSLLFPHKGYLSSLPHRSMILYFLAYIPTALFFINLALTQLSLPFLIPLLGMAYQVFSSGFVLNLLSAYAVNYSSFRRTGARKTADSVDVEAVLAGVLVGCCLPSWFIWEKASQEWTLAWQAFPVYAYLVQTAYGLSMRKIVGRKGGGSPRPALGLSYALLVGLSVTAHLPLVHHLLSASSSSRHSIQALFLPDFSLESTARNHTEAVTATLQYDLIFTVLAFYALFTLRSNGSIGRKIRIAASCLLGTVVGGPGVGTILGWMTEEPAAGKGGKDA